jgi:transposase
MLTLPSSVRIYLAPDPVDLRRGPDGLAALVRSLWQLDPFAGHLFCFVGKRRNRIKILFFDRGGFVIYYKRLERGRFRLPVVAPNARSIRLDPTQLSMLLDGIVIERVARPRHWQPPAESSMEGVGHG